MKELVIGFLGGGNIGSGVWMLLQDIAPELERRNGLAVRVKRVLVKAFDEPRKADIPESVLTTNPDDVLTDPEITLVAEFMGGEHPAADFMLRALENGKSVVTANKVALALAWPKLEAAAEAHGVGLYYEASVGGAIPIIQVLRSSMGANRITSVMAIINGTTNYILTRMAEEGASYDAVLADAQRLGLAEPNPAADVEGLDAAYKLSIMSSLAFHTHIPFDKVYREGITKVTAEDIAYGREMGYVLKLLAIAKKDNNVVEARVHPTFLKKNHPLASVNGSFNAVFFRGHACREMMLQGLGAGDYPTAGAVVSDILNAADADKPRYPDFPITEKADPTLVFNHSWRCRYYIRLSAADQPGVLAGVSKCFAQEGVSIATMMQKDAHADGRVPLIFITHDTEERAMHAALERLDSSLCELESVLRVED